MAQREDLRELQTRLADRLSQARNQTAVGASWLAVKISGKNFLLPLSQSGEVLGWSGVEPVPYTKPWMLGVTSIRGILLTVVDLARMLGMPAARSEQVFASASVVALNPMMGVNAALFPVGAFHPGAHLHCRYAVAPVIDDLPHYADVPSEFGGSGALADW